jgi:hypothetical protein
MASSHIVAQRRHGSTFIVGELGRRLDVVDPLEELAAIDDHEEEVIVITRGKGWRYEKVSCVGIRDLLYLYFQTVT